MDVSTQQPFVSHARTTSRSFVILLLLATTSLTCMQPSAIAPRQPSHSTTGGADVTTGVKSLKNAANSERVANNKADGNGRTVSPSAANSVSRRGSLGSLVDCDEDCDDDTIDDGGETDGQQGDGTQEAGSGENATPLEHPFAGYTDKELAQLYAQEPASVGCLSVGATNRGRLINGVQMPEGPYWELNDKAHIWGTSETIQGLIRCIERVNEQFPDTQKMRIGHISKRNGGPISPHVSHQAGRDVDVSYYYNEPTRWFARANEKNLDKARTWAFVKALITQTDVEMILIDIGLQRVLRDHAKEIGEDEAWLDDIFRGSAGKGGPIIRHSKGHATHIHIRFYSPIARETARRLAPVLGTPKASASGQSYVSYRAKKGDTLGSLANRFGTTVAAIRQANGLRSSAIQARKTYQIPTTKTLPDKPSNKRNSGAISTGPISAPPRRLPPTAVR